MERFLWPAVTLVLGLLLAAIIWQTLRRAAQRRARRLAYQRAAHERPSRFAATMPGISRERVVAIRKDAERAAMRAWAAALPPPPSPHPEGTREYVLWVASYHLKLSELSEPADAPAPSPAV